MRRLLALLLTILLLAPSSFGWYGFGHMAVAYVAYQHLDPAVKSRANVLIRKNPSYAAWKKQLPSGLAAEQRNEMLFMIAATWPDEIRSDPGYHDDGPAGGNVPPLNGGNENIGYGDKARHKYWHFMDTPIAQDGTIVEPSPAPNAETQIKEFARGLSSGSQDRKSYDLVWLMHLVGDVHQPLHTTARFSADLPHGDSGGNGVAINTPTPCKDDTKANKLHGLWDGAPGDMQDPQKDPQKVITFAAALAPQNVLSADQNVDDWITESVLLAETKVYVSPIGNGKGPWTVDQAYCDQMRTVAEQRVVQAGMRLANLMNAYLK